MTKSIDDLFDLGKGLDVNIDTQYIRVDPDSDLKTMEESLAPAAAILASDGLVAFPTETVYGLGANAFSPEAVGKIYEAKGRPSDNPMIVHVAGIEDMRSLVTEWPAIAEKLAEAFMPGPLTIILNKTDRLSPVVSGGLNTIGLRIPENRVARTLIRLAAVPVAAPSANRSGRPSPTKASHVMTDMNGRIECVVDGGSTSLGIESTVLDLTSDKGPRILRPGAVTYEDLLSFFSRVGFKMDQEARNWLAGAAKSSLSGDADMSQAPKAPGMKYRHYAPRATVYLLEGDVKMSWMHLKHIATSDKIGLFSSEELYRLLQPDESVAVHIFGSKADSASAAHDLFAALRKFDELGCGIIVAESLSEEQVGRAYMNRLRKAASYLINQDRVTKLQDERSQ